jgi:hypothetical protein
MSDCHYERCVDYQYSWYLLSLHAPLGDEPFSLAASALITRHTTSIDALARYLPASVLFSPSLTVSPLPSVDIELQVLQP